MSFPTFKDLDKSVADIFNEDFDYKYTLKVKSAGPQNTVSIFLKDRSFLCQVTFLVHRP